MKEARESTNGAASPKKVLLLRCHHGIKAIVLKAGIGGLNCHATVTAVKQVTVNSLEFGLLLHCWRRMTRFAAWLAHCFLGSRII